MSSIKVFELIKDGTWKEGINFDFVPVGKSFTTKTVCFSPKGVNIADLKVMIENKDDFIFTKSNDHLMTEWKSLTPFKILDGEMSNPIKIEFLVKSGPVRMDNLHLVFEYLEIP